MALYETVRSNRGWGGEGEGGWRLAVAGGGFMVALGGVLRGLGPPPAPRQHGLYAAILVCSH